MTDVELLEKHRKGDEEAFAELVKRHIGWVYGVARRRLRDAHLAEDTAQATFVLLHRKAPRFPSDSAMIAWLHKSAWYATETAAKIERRRLRRETEAAMLQPKTAGGAADTEWYKLAPMLDALIGKLGHGDREAVLLRYYRGMSFAEVGKEIGATEEAARKRVERAIDKLRQMAAKEGMSLSAAALAGHLGVHAVVAPPVGLTAVATGAAAAPVGSTLAASSGVIVKGAIIMASTKAVIAGVTGLALFVCVSATIWKMAYADHEAASAPVGAAPTPETVPGGGDAQGAQPELAIRDPWAGAAGFAKLSPFTAARWRGSIYEVRVDPDPAHFPVWYELVSIDGQKAEDMFAFAQQSDRDNWQKRVDEDLVQLLSRMGHPPGDTVQLVLRQPAGGGTITMEHVAMTKENRNAIWAERNKDLAIDPATQPADRGSRGTGQIPATQLP